VKLNEFRAGQNTALEFPASNPGKGKYLLLARMAVVHSAEGQDAPDTSAASENAKSAA
jgi:hypothetical protein